MTGASSILQFHNFDVILLDNSYEMGSNQAMCACSTPSVSKMHADTSADLDVVAKVLLDVYGVSNYNCPQMPTLTE